jgi:regulator of protease activity HflC (stomatin/prohibitin superfamily)
MVWISQSIVLVLLALLVASSLRILREYQRGVVFQLGRFWRVKGPGLVILVPGIQQMVKVDLRTVVFEVPTQDVISRDNVSVKVSAVVGLRIIDAANAHSVEIISRDESIGADDIAIGLGQHELDDMLAGQRRTSTSSKRWMHRPTRESRSPTSR